MLERNRRSLAATALVSLALPALAAPPSGGRTVPLADLLGEARIESPLLAAEPAQEIADLKNPVMDVLVDQGFDDFDWEFEGWEPIGGLSIVKEGENHVLEVSDTGDRPALGWVRPVRHDSFYRFSRSVRVAGIPFGDFYVVESRLEPEDARVDPDQYFLAGRGQALKVHAVGIQSGEESGGAWQHGSVSFFPSPRTRSLIVLARGAVGSDELAAQMGMRFDDFRLEEVKPSSSQRLRLLKAAHAASDMDPALGMRKAGLLLPLASPEGAREGEPAEMNYDWREALYAPAPTSITFEIEVPESAHLRLATGLARESRPRSRARFRVEVHVAGGDEPAVLLDSARTAEAEDWHWADHDLDLGAWAGQRVALVLRTVGEKGDPHPLWANPRLETVTPADPLVILIAVDTLRADRLGAYGYERETSPALDRLAAEGVRFDQARSNCNWTCPSFASIFTGLVPSRHGVSSYGPATPLPAELTTLAEYFQGEGWATRSIAYKVPLFDGNYEQGFDRAFNVPRDVIRGEENLKRALEWLESHRGGPSFLFLHFNDPHQPFVHPEPLGRDFGFAVEAGTDPRNDSSEEEFAALYDGAVAYVDSCIGRFLDALRERDLYDGATVAFVADHGEELFDRGGFGHGGARLNDEVVRVPLIVKPPAGSFEAGRVVTTDVSGFDVMPTLLDLAGIEPEEGLDARTLVPLIEGRRRRRGGPVVTETSSRGFALMDGGFKYILYAGQQIERLYHVESDPGELTEISAEVPEVLEELRGKLIAYLLEHRPGDYLLVHTGDRSATLTIASSDIRPWVGVPPSAPRSRTGGQSTITLPAGLWTLVELEGRDTDDVAVEGIEVRGVERGFDPWVPGAFEDLEGRGLWRVRGPEPVVAAIEETQPETVDLEMLEALERLGYVGD